MWWRRVEEALKDYSWYSKRSRDPEYDLKKRIEELKNYIPTGGTVVLFQDEKGPIAAKTYGGTSWCSVQAKVEHAQKIKGILNVFGIYDYIQMIECLLIVTKKEERQRIHRILFKG